MLYLSPMDRKKYNELKRKVEDEYQRDIQAATEKKIKNLEAIDRVWLMEHPPREPKNQVEQVANKRPLSDSASYGALATAVAKALEFVPETFSKDDIRTALKTIAPEVESKFNDVAITGRLIRMTKEGLIVRTLKGTGSTASQYRKKKKTDVGAENSPTDNDKDIDFS